MTTVPPSGTPPPQLPAGPAPAPAVQILNPPPAIAALPPGTVLEGVVKPATATAETAPNPAKPTVIVRTALGDVTIRVPTPLPDNARVALEVLRAASTGPTPQTQTQIPDATTSTPQVTVRLVSINDQPAVQMLAQLARQAADARGTAAVPLQQGTVPENDPQNPLLRAATLPQGAAWTLNGPTQLPSLGTISALVMMGTPASASPETLISAAETIANTNAGTNAAPASPLISTTPNTPLPLASANITMPIAAGANTIAATPPVSAQPFALVSGSELGVRVTEIVLPNATVGPAATSVLGAAGTQPQLNPLPSFIAPPTTPLNGTPPQGAPSLSPLPQSQETSQPGLVLVSAKGLGVAPPPPPTVVEVAPVLTTLTGTVTGQNVNGTPVIETTAGQIQLNVRANLPVGTRIVLDITAQFAARADLPPPPMPPSTLPLSGPAGIAAGWPTLSESLATLQRTDPVAAQQLAQVIPDGGPRTAAAIISFVQAMRTGDTRQWPGNDNLRALERAGPRGAHLASQLSEEVGALSSRARETGTEWRALPIPWNAEGRIDRIALITRREGESDEDGKRKPGGGGTRFLIDLDMSRLGSMQFDGMFRKEVKGFDMMVRTKAPLPETIRHDLTGIFAASNAAMGLKGGLTFQVVKKFADPIGQGTPLTADRSGLWA